MEMKAVEAKIVEGNRARNPVVLMQARAALLDAAEELVQRAAAESRGLTPEEVSEADDLVYKAAAVDADIASIRAECAPDRKV